MRQIGADMVKVWCIYIIWLLAVTALNIFVGSQTAFVLLLLLVVFPVLAAILLRILRIRIRLQLSFEAAGCKGQPLAGYVELRNDTPLVFRNTVFQMECRNLLTGERTELKGHAFLGAFDSTKVPVSLLSTFCGTIGFDNATVRVYDFFGLTFRSIGMPAEGAVAVAPELRDAETVIKTAVLASPVGGDVSVSDIRPGTSADTQEVIAVREYMPGDNPRRIHWKLSQRYEQLWVREAPPSVSRSVLLLLETGVQEESLLPEPAVAEAMAVALLSISRTLCKLEIPHAVAWQDQRKGEFKLIEIKNQQDHDGLTVEILSSGCTVDEYACFQYYKQQETCPYSRYIYVSPVIPPGTELMAPRLTVLLAEKEPTRRDTGSHVIPFTPETLSDVLACAE